MMYQKALLFADEEISKQILNTNNPSAIKALGRKVKGFSEKKWNQNKNRIVFEANVMKFLHNPEIRNDLLDKHKNGKYTFVESSPYDIILVIGYEEHLAIKNVENWGQNLLGKCITNVAYLLVEF